MKYAADAFDTLPRIPSWVTSARPQTLEDVAFLSGAALSYLHLVLAHPDMPHGLLRARLALKAAEVCVTHSGRPERAADLRDAVAFVQPGDSPGPAGEVYRSWQRAVDRPVWVKSLHRALPHLAPEQIAVWLDGCDPYDGGGPRSAGHGAAVARAASVLEAVINERPRDYGAALIFADAVLAQAFGWSHLFPVLSLGLKRVDLRLDGEDLRNAIHRGIGNGASQVMQDAADLTRRAGKLRSVAPKLRAKGADAAVEFFLTRDTVAPADLTWLGSKRAARRFCERLVELGAARELTGRDTFRLYGL